MNRNQPHEALENHDRLINTCKECIPDAQIVVGGILQRFQRNLDWRDTYEGKRKQFNRELKLLAEKSGCVFSEAPYLKEYDVYDGVHITDKTGLPKLVSAYKRTTNNLLGIKRNQNNQSGPRTKSPQNRMNYNEVTANYRYEKSDMNHSGRVRNPQSSRGSYYNFEPRLPSHDLSSTFDQCEDNYYTNSHNNQHKFIDYNHSYENSNKSYKQKHENVSSNDKLKWFLKSFIEELQNAE